MNNGDVIVAALQAIYDERQALTAEIVTEVATDPASVLHDQLEWDDTVCGIQYRLDQARQLIRRFQIVIEDHPVRQFPYIGSQKSYVPLEAAMTSTDWRQELVADFKREADRFARRWRDHKFVAEHYNDWLRQQNPPDTEAA